MSIYLHKVDKMRTKKDDLYGEDDLIFLNPIEILAIININPTENKSYLDNATIRYEQHGNIEVKVFQPYLYSRKIEIEYGDYFEYKMSHTSSAYYQVVDSNTKNYTSNFTILGKDRLWRIIKAAPADKNERFFT
jgi:hypothetical protein